MTACLILVFALSIGLSWYTYGYLDGATVARMAAVLIPILAVAAFVVLRSGRNSREDPRMLPDTDAARPGATGGRQEGGEPGRTDTWVRAEGNVAGAEKRNGGEL